VPVVDTPATDEQVEPVGQPAFQAVEAEGGKARGGQFDRQ
jgi:hypothetical protein